ncbi:MAG: maleylacetate reductase [Pseudomonadota bacterium]
MSESMDVAGDGIATFGPGLRRTVGRAVRDLGGTRALVLSTPHQSDMAQDTAADLGDLAAGVFDQAAMHTPVDVTLRALDHLRAVKADCLVAVGGGSTIGLGKALAYRTDLPQVAIPTTYAGSEATPILGQTEDGQKITLTDPKVAPDIVLYDPELVVGLPATMTVTSALNAMAHAAEALYAANRTDDSDAQARAGLDAFVHGLPKVLNDPTDLAAREATQKGAWSCGRVLGRVGMALHHKLCHTLGGSFGLPHAETHAIVLPHAIAYNARSAAAELKPITDMLGGPDPGTALHRFADRMGAPRALRDIGLGQGDLPRAAKLASEQPYPNPHPVTEGDLFALLRAAWAGHAPVF